MKFITSCALLCFLLLALPAASQAQTTPRPTQTTVPTALPATQTAVAATRSVLEARRTVEARRTARAAQATATPTSAHPFPLFNPTGTDISSCGLPTRSALFSSAATFNMTADCRYSHSDIHRSGASLLDFSAGGPYTINGNGHSIIGPVGARTISVANNVTLNLNNVTIRDAGGVNIPVVEVSTGGTFTAVNLTFQSNRALSAVAVTMGSVDFRNARFRDNRFQQAAVTSVHQLNRVFINQAEFVNNAITEDESVLLIQAGDLILEGRIGYRANTGFLGGQANLQYVGDIVNLVSANAEFIEILLPKKKKEEVRPTLTATARPRYAASYTALQTATGMTFEATYGLDSGVHFRQLDGAGIGVQSIIDAGYLAALDVYGYVEQGVEVCFPQIGRVIFLDARTIPRAITALDATVRDGMTCVYLNSPGSLVLMPN